MVLIDDALLLRRTVKDDLPLPRRQIPKGHVGAHAHFPGNVLHQRPHQRLPGGDGPLVDGERFIRHQRGLVHRADDARSIAAAAGAGAVEGELFRPRGDDKFPADRTADLFFRRHVQGRRDIVPVGTAMAGQAGVHEAQAVEKLGPRAKGAADPRDAGTLVQGQRGGHIAQLVHLGLGRLGHAAAGVGGERFQIAPGALGVQNAQGQRGFSGAGDAGDSHDLMERYIRIDVF